VLAPQLHGLHWLLGANYLQHAGAQPGLGPEASSGENIDYSRNFTGWINLIWFNIGYHTAHHENGRIHWSDLPQQHRSYEHQVPDWLKVNSLAWYFVRVLIFQRGQVRFSAESSAEMGRKI
jgi:fatty acid desaturase